MGSFKEKLEQDFITLKHDILYHISQFLRGLKDGFRFNYFIHNLRDPKVRKACLECVVLVLGIFISSIAIYNYLLIPFLRSQYDEYFYLARIPFEFIWNTFWILPSYIATFIYSMKWYDEIAKSIIMEKVRANEKSNKKDLLKSASEFKTTLTLCISILTSIVLYIPYIGVFLSLLWNAWLYAYYSFEYRWNLEVKKPPSRFILYIQYYWSYFLGFGAPLALLTFRLSFSASFGVFSVLFPFYLIMSFHKDTTPYTKMSPTKEYNVRIFEIPELINKNMLKLVTGAFSWTRKLELKKLDTEKTKSENSDGKEEIKDKKDLDPSEQLKASEISQELETENLDQENSFIQKKVVEKDDSIKGHEFSKQHISSEVEVVSKNSNEAKSDPETIEDEFHEPYVE